MGGNDKYRGDGICDEKNNIEACNWDNGDCCNNYKNGWDNHCHVSYIITFYQNRNILFKLQKFLKRNNRIL